MEGDICLLAYSMRVCENVNRFAVVTCQTGITAEFDLKLPPHGKGAVVLEVSGRQKNSVVHRLLLISQGKIRKEVWSVWYNSQIG